MPILVIMEMKGDSDRLLAAADEIGRLAPVADGLLARVLAPTDDGTILIHLWESETARTAWNANPAPHAALRASGIQTLATERIVREYATHHVELPSCTEVIRTD